MNKKIYFICMMFIVLPLSALAEHQISLKNGNVAKGEIQGNVLKFNTELGTLEAPVEEIKSISVTSVRRKDGSSIMEVAMEMQDGTTLKGNFAEKTLAVKTRYGVLNVKLEDIKEVSKVEEPAQPARTASMPVKEAPAPQAQEPTGRQSNHRSDVNVEPGRSVRDDLSMQGRLGTGMQLNLINPWLGPTVDYWITENMGVSGTIGVSQDFKYVGIRGTYLFNKRLDIYGLPVMRPYVGIGYASVTGPEETATNALSEPTTIETEGSGFELYGGILQPAPYIAKNVYLRPEIIYSTVKVEGSSGFLTNDQTASVDANYSAIGLGLSVVYYFK